MTLEFMRFTQLSLEYIFLYYVNKNNQLNVKPNNNKLML